MRKMLNITVTVDNPDDRIYFWETLQEKFTELYKNIAERATEGVSANISTLDLDSSDSGEEFFDEGTLLKVYEAINEYTGSEVETRDIITKIQNAGIVFRELRP